MQHKKAKEVLTKHLQEPYDIEYWVDAIQQQIDVYLPIEKPLIIEYQQSVISARLLSERDRAYKHLTEYVFWIGDDKIWHSSKIRRWQKALLYYRDEYGYYAYYLSTDKEQLYRIVELPILYNQDDWRSQIHVLSPIVNIRQWFLVPQQYKKVIHHQQKARAILRESIMQQEVYRPFIMWLKRMCNCTLFDMPEIIFAKRWQCLLVDNPGWQVLVLAWCFLRQEKVFSPQELHEWLMYCVQQKVLQLSTLPLVTKDILHDLVSALLSFFKYYALIA